MDINFSIELDPNAGIFAKEISGDVEKVSKELVKQVVELAPQELRDLMGNDSPSQKGSPPANRSGNLSRSYRAIGDNQISMAGYIRYLDDSVFSGYLNRPILAKGIEKALVKVAKPL